VGYCAELPPIRPIEGSPRVRGVVLVRVAPPNQLTPGCERSTDGDQPSADLRERQLMINQYSKIAQNRASLEFRMVVFGVYRFALRVTVSAMPNTTA
jgi:hypothetical protein